MMDRLGRIMRQRQAEHLPPPPVASPATLMPGDVILLEDGRDFLVRVALDCREQPSGAARSWRWLLLDDGSLFSVTGDTLALYAPPALLRRGSPEFDHLTGPADQGGLLRLFESHAGSPVIFDSDGEPYAITSTGTFTATLNGMTDASVWRDVSERASDNVYVTFGADGDRLGLGIWTSDFAFYRGALLTRAEIKGLYSHA